MLFSAGVGEINPGGLDAAVSHQVSQEGDIVEFCQKVFGKPMAEGMGVDCVGINSVLQGIMF